MAPLHRPDAPFDAPLWTWLGPLLALAVAGFVACCLDLEGKDKPPRKRRPAPPAPSAGAAGAAAAAAAAAPGASGRMCTSAECLCDPPFGRGPGRRGCWAAPPPAPDAADAAGADGERARRRMRPSAWPAFVAGSSEGRLGAQ